MRTFDALEGFCDRGRFVAGRDTDAPERGNALPAPLMSTSPPPRPSVDPSRGMDAAAAADGVVAMSAGVSAGVAVVAMAPAAAGFERVGGDGFATQDSATSAITSARKARRSCGGSASSGTSARSDCSSLMSCPTRHRQ
jgi:hypothetical protein